MLQFALEQSQQTLNKFVGALSRVSREMYSSQYVPQVKGIIFLMSTGFAIEVWRALAI